MPGTTPTAPAPVDRPGRVLILDDAPSLPAVLARAAVTAPRRHGQHLPDLTVEQREVRTDVSRLAAYDRVCGFALRDTVPSTWLHVLTFPLQAVLMADREFPLALPGLVHVRNQMVQHRPVRATETLSLRASARDLRPHRRGAQVDLVGQAHVGEELVWEGVSTYLARGVRLRPEAAPEHPQDEAQPAAAELPALDPAEATTETLWRVPAGIGRRYAGVSGDVNPIHLNPLAARAFGFRRTIAHGMWVHARALAVLEPRLPERYAVQVAFRKPLFVPGRVTFLARAGEPADGGNSWTFAVRSPSRDRVHLLGRLG
ncbi:MAG TPA: MaoC/PaaZ C-terminal domain-containing protein [Segeticoccus sp.]|uniref:MaoC/PaaZ C-terminal domain-containing protein n=1 Tax=Segeticoccus sp. TaxID=2706531 RepID=UPI002D7EDBBE|nr:MaoC/PaaZ C-terminal domain-containing protein [Segeticoccus sp.]HET8599750.1 MaoC/PaaZ C-terminal domain-containing protein [Segeticoccus sp.]